MSDEFDFDKAPKGLQLGQKIIDKGGVPTLLIEKLTEDFVPNRKNEKKVRSITGPFELDTLRDRAGTFEPQLLKQYQTSFSDDSQAKILSVYNLGTSVNQVEDLYGIKISTATLSGITECSRGIVYFSSRGFSVHFF